MNDIVKGFYRQLAEDEALAAEVNEAIAAVARRHGYDLAAEDLVVGGSEDELAEDDLQVVSGGHFCGVQMVKLDELKRAYGR